MEVGSHFGATLKLFMLKISFPTNTFGAAALSGKWKMRLC